MWGGGGGGGGGGIKLHTGHQVTQTLPLHCAFRFQKGQERRRSLKQIRAVGQRESWLKKGEVGLIVYDKEKIHKERKSMITN